SCRSGGSSRWQKRFRLHSGHAVRAIAPVAPGPLCIAAMRVAFVRLAGHLPWSSRGAGRLKVEGGAVDIFLGVIGLFPILALADQIARAFLVLFGRRRRTSVIVGTPAVSVLRPGRGIENHIEETLRSGLELSYPNYEMIFCVADEA